MFMHGQEYRATVDLKLDHTIDGKGLRDLLGLLVSVKKELVLATHGKGFGTVHVHGRLRGVGVEATWTYYQVDKGSGAVTKCL